MKIFNHDNVFILIFKIYATVGSGSFAIASSFDSLLDLMGGGITHLSMKNINTKDHYFDVVTNIVGLLAASPEVLQKLVTRHPEIKRIDTVGVLYSVEVDIELPKESPLKEAHAIGENLQMKLEKLPEVERAFVYLDFECDHKPEHNVSSRPPHPFCR